MSKSDCMIDSDTLQKLGRAIRGGDDDEVEQILIELGPLAVEALEALEDRGATAPADWGTDR